ncbi:hypothetical protein EK21DRAFT_97503 [Setomelanomma holmii]|uniref:Autophagy-related protein 29 n=1 Tax=Setomelanomma holmii TaxID=210430 RepID=A0A9P4HFU9_9PLEO|nr:hypothetical protein EK21DRAFT_97503 [Setomelanomma holmii]
MSNVQFTALVRLPFARGNFVDPAQAQWDADKDRQLWKVISKSSKTSDLNCIAGKFQVPPSFLLQQAAWLYERHLDHVRSQMKKVSGSNVPTASTSVASNLTVTGGVTMQRTGSGGSLGRRTTSALSGRQRDSPSLRGGEATATAPPLSRTPSTNTITQSRANTQQLPVRTQSTRSVQRPNLTSPKPEERKLSSAPAPPSPLDDSIDSPDIPASSSSSSSSSSDTDHPAHRSQLFKRPPRFTQQRPKTLSTFEEGEGAQEGDGSGSHDAPSLPFASAAKRQPSTPKYAQDTLFRTNSKPEQKVLTDRSKPAPPIRQKSMDQQSQATASSMTTSASESDAPVPKATGKSPMSPQSNHRAELGRLGSPRQKGPRLRKEGSEGTPSMGSSFSDIDGMSCGSLERYELMFADADYNQTPPITTHYLHRNNALVFRQTYTSIKSLLTHPPCPHNPPSDTITTWPCAPCESIFTERYWTAAARLLDYLADFAHRDTPLMNSLWFHLLDIWQESRSWLPCEDVLASARVSPRSMKLYERVRWFLEEWKAVRELMDAVVFGVRQQPGTGGVVGMGVREAILHNPNGEKWSPAGTFETGPWVSGLRGWEEWLGEGRPGVAAPRVQPAGMTEDEGEDEGDADREATRTVRYVPMPAIAIMKAHTERARSIAAQIDPSPDFLQTFDQNSLHSPTSSDNSAHTYTSLTGRTVTYQLSNGAPPVSRYYGYGDPQMLCSRQDLNLVDECVATCRGIEAYEPVSGVEEEDGESDEEEPFDVWTVWEGKADEESKDEEKKVVEGWHEMFDDWI